MRQGRDWANDEFLFFYLARRCRRRPGRVLAAAAASSPPVGPGPLGRKPGFKKKKKNSPPFPPPPSEYRGIKNTKRFLSLSFLTASLLSCPLFARFSARFKIPPSTAVLNFRSLLTLDLSSLQMRMQR